mmetsp:Transcript_19023/g.46729  ORF Transcript_19023/g.46729 Transcript_19023/m.46729 type:complete len:148 (-) Transcript_19023:75-518(-)
MSATARAMGARTGPATETSRAVLGAASGRGGGRGVRAAYYKVLDVVDFGAPSGIKGRPGLSEPVANAGKLLLRRSEAVKGNRKRWHEDKVTAPPPETARAAEVLVGKLAARQPVLATIVGRAHEAQAAGDEGMGSRASRQGRRRQHS